MKSGFVLLWNVVTFHKSPVTLQKENITMQSLHNRLMSIVQAQQEEHNKVTQDTDGKHNIVTAPQRPAPSTLFRLSSNYATVMSSALRDQLDRFCESERKTRSRAIRDAVYALMETPALISTPPANLPTVGQPPTRNCIISWTMPSNKPDHVEHFHNLCAGRGNQSNFVRRAIYRHTQQYRSTDPSEHKDAVKDAWF
jgi:hypothetical protein